MKLLILDLTASQDGVARKKPSPMSVLNSMKLAESRPSWSKVSSPMMSLADPLKSDFSTNKEKLTTMLSTSPTLTSQ